MRGGEINIQNQPRREYEVGYPCEYQAVYQPKCRPVGPHKG